MVDNNWRDSFVVNVNKNRLGREYEAVEKEDNSTLLELERKINQAKPTGGDGLFAGTSFETPENGGPTNLIKNGLSISASSVNNVETLTTEDNEPDEEDGINKRASKRITIYNRATAVLEDFAERLSSSGGALPLRRKSKEEDIDREKSMDSERRRSSAPQRVKSVVAKLQKATSRRRTKQMASEQQEFDAEQLDVESETVIFSENPSYMKSPGRFEE